MVKELKIILFIIYFIILIQFGLTKNCVKIIKRQKWGGLKPKEVDYQIIPVSYVIVHHTAGDSCSMLNECSSLVREIQKYHMQKLNWADIGYNFLIGNDGNIYEGRGWHKIGAHTKNFNAKGLGVAFIGNFNDELPSNQAIKSFKRLLKCGIASRELDKKFKLLAARQIKPTQSPGLKLYVELQKWNNWSSVL